MNHIQQRQTSDYSERNSQDHNSAEMIRPHFGSTRRSDISIGQAALSSNAIIGLRPLRPQSAVTDILEKGKSPRKSSSRFNQSELEMDSQHHVGRATFDLMSLQIDHEAAQRASDIIAGTIIHSHCVFVRHIVIP